MREIWVADAETDPFKFGRIPRPFLWGAYCLERDEYHEFESTVDFVNFITEGEKIVYAHNGGKFDWHLIAEFFDDFQELLVISNRIAKFKIGDAEFRDSYSILPVPLSAYKKDEISYEIFEKDERYKPNNWVKIREYLRADCVYLAEFVAGFVKEYGANLTIASSAMAYWRKLTKTKSPEGSKLFYESISPYYYGGRVECFQTGIIENDFKVADINSAYPAAMMKHHPWGFETINSDTLPNEGVERCFIKLRAPSLGFFPYREKSLTFPNDGEIREFYVTGWEYLNFIKWSNAAHEIISVKRFPLKIEFSEYVNHFYAKKENSEKGSPEYIFAKLFLNSLYGKFGANPDKYRQHMVIDPAYIRACQKEGYSYCGDMGKLAVVSRPIDPENARYFNVATAASITGCVRASLSNAIMQCGGVIYCDTDCVVARDVSRLELDPKKLGAWDIEAECDFGAVAGKKLYAFRQACGGWKKANKGVRLSADQIVKVARGETVNYKSDAPTFSVSGKEPKFISRNISLTTN